MTNLVDAAVEYLNAGLTVFALDGKQPNTAIPGEGWREISGKVEPGDGPLLVEVFEHPHTTGIGIAIPVGLCVVDIDGEEGAMALAALLETVPYGWQDTAAASTGRGMHLWYQTIKEVRSTVLAPKLDLKGVGGYVAAPPSAHPNGAVYTWLQSLIVDGIVSAALLPEPIFALLADREEGPTAKPWVLKIGGSALEYDRGGSMEGLARKVAEAGDGERNNVLNWAAWRAREHGYSRAEAEQALGAASTLPAHEIKQTIRSAYRG